MDSAGDYGGTTAPAGPPCTPFSRARAGNLVDADTGFGNALNVRHTVRTLERAGADCIELEDQVAPKRCDHFSGKEVISTEEAVGKIRAAVDARQDRDLLIMARTDAAATHGFEAAVERAQKFAEAGSDILFAERQRLVGKPAWDALAQRYS